MTKAAAQAPTGHELFEGRPILLDTSTTPRDAYNEVHRRLGQVRGSLHVLTGVNLSSDEVPEGNLRQMAYLLVDEVNTISALVDTIAQPLFTVRV